MNIKDTVDYLEGCFKSKERKTVNCLLGAPGVGKTSVVAEAANRVGKQILTLALPTCDAVDLRGLPKIENNKTTWASPLPKNGEGILLLDELTSAPKDVQVAAHHIVWSEYGSDMSLPKTWHIVLTGNRSTDKTAFQAMGAPLRNRLTILNIESNVEDWSKWAIKNNIDHKILGFLRWRPELLTTKTIPNEGAFVSPRSWENVSNIIKLDVSAEIEAELLTGTIGEGAAIEFTAYLRNARQTPEIKKIINSPNSALVPDDASVLYAITSALSIYTLTNKHIIMEYISRLPAEFGMMYLNDIKDKINIKNDPYIKKWIAKHKNMFDLS